MIIEDIVFLQDLPYATQIIIARVAMFIAIVFLIAILQTFTRLALMRPLRRMARRTGFRHDDAIIQAMTTPIRLLVIALAFFIAGAIFRVDADNPFDVFIGNIGETFVILALLTAFYKLADLLAPNADRLTRVTGLHVQDRLLPFLRTGFKLIIMAIGLVIILQEWGYDVSGLIAGLGLGGLAFSLAAQDTVSNLFGFMAIVSDNPFDVGEYIIMPSAEGIVEHVGLRTTQIRTLDQALIYVPNNEMANSAITNWSRLEKRRMNYVLGVTYDTTSGDLRVLLHRIREYLKSQETVDEESVTVIFMDFGDSSLEILVRAYVMIQDWAEFNLEKERIHMEIMDVVDELGIGIAFPSMSLYVENIPPVSAPQTDSSPRLTSVEKALRRGTIQSKEEQIKTTENSDENITGQQDEGD